MKAMILAAGRGERMGSLTADTPKPLLEVGGESLIERHLRRLAASGIAEVVVNLSYLGGQIRERLGDGRRWQLAISYSEEGEPALETAGGVVHALPLLGDAPFLLVSADVYTDFDFAALPDTAAGVETSAGTAAETSAGTSAGTATGTLVMVPNPPHHPHGDFGLRADGVLIDAPPRRTYAGIGVFDPALFRGLPAGRRPLRPVLDDAIARGALTGVSYQGAWLDIGTPQRFAEACARAGPRRGVDTSR